MRNTTGEARAASVEVKTSGHAGSSTWPAETKIRVPLRRGKLPLRERSATKEVGVMGFVPRSTLLPRASERPSGRGG